MKLPKVIYVAVANTGSGSKEDEFLSATADPTELAETGEVVNVGRYQLVELGTVTAEPIFVKAKTR